MHRRKQFEVLTPRKGASSHRPRSPEIRSARHSLTIGVVREEKQEKRGLPPGYVQCDVCGEFNGSTDAKNLSWGDRTLQRDRLA
jgi:hypothetical protein